MLFEDAARELGRFLAPVTTDEFLDQTLVGGFRRIPGGDPSERADLLGPEPEAVLRGAAHLASKLTFHSANPSGPPPSLAAAGDGVGFNAAIEAFHAANYSVRFPELRPLSPQLDRLARALEMLLHQPVTASAFWSRAGIKAPAHYDNHDLLVVQLRGEKRWQISTRPSLHPNTWAPIGRNAPELGPHEDVDVSPGDVLYLPRGTFHAVESDAESLHLAIGFTPLTARDILIAAVDHLSDLEPGLRRTVGQRLAFQIGEARGLDPLAGLGARAAELLLSACRAPEFLSQALLRRSSRAVAGMAGSISQANAAVGLDDVLVQHSSGFCHLTATAETIDISYPGGQLSVHSGAQEPVSFMIDTPRFRVRDIPGAADDGVRLALAARFLDIGLLDRAPVA